MPREAQQGMARAGAGPGVSVSQADRGRNARFRPGRGTSSGCGVFNHLRQQSFWLTPLRRSPGRADRFLRAWGYSARPAAQTFAAQLPDGQFHRRERAARHPRAGRRKMRQLSGRLRRRPAVRVEALSATPLTCQNTRRRNSPRSDPSETVCGFCDDADGSSSTGPHLPPGIRYDGSPRA